MNWQNLTYQTKLKLLPIGFLVAILLVYWLAISKTLQLSGQVQQLETQVEKLGDAPLQVQILKKRLGEIEDRIGDNSGNITQEGIFDALSNYCKKNKLTMREFPVPHELTKDDYLVQTYQVEVEGTFHGLVNLVYYLEQQAYLGKVAATRFLLKKDKRTREEYLNLSIYLQTVN